MCGIAGYSLSARSDVDRTLAAQSLLAGIAERGADAVGYAHRSPHDTYAIVTKQRTPASRLLDRIAVPPSATELLVHVRDYTKGHPSIAANNHPVRHGPVVGIHNGIILNDDELLEPLSCARCEPRMTVDSEAIFAARGVGRPLWIGKSKHELFFASTRAALEVVERYAQVRLRKREIGDGTFLEIADARITHEERFRPDHGYRDPIALPAVRAPGEGVSCLERLAVLAAAV